MKLKLRIDDNGQFGFVETYKCYKYDTGAVKMRVLANAGDYISEPYVFRKGVFIPAKKIDEEMGIFRYLKAKKPFYSVLGKGNLILDMRVSYNLKTLEFIKDKSYFNMFYVVKDSLCQKNDDWYVDIRRLSSSNDELISWLDNLGKKLALMGDDRKDFLKSRMR